jgi:hypothetical protein
MRKITKWKKILVGNPKTEKPLGGGGGVVARRIILKRNLRTMKLIYGLNSSGAAYNYSSRDA